MMIQEMDGGRSPMACGGTLDIRTEEERKWPTTGFTAYAVPEAAGRTMIDSGAGIAPGEPNVGARSGYQPEKRRKAVDCEILHRIEAGKQNRNRTGIPSADLSHRVQLCGMRRFEK